MHERVATHLAGVAVLGGDHGTSRWSARRWCLFVGGLHVMRGELTIGSLLVVIAYLGAVYGPLSAIAHTTGQLQGALAGARRVRAMFALIPERPTTPPDGDRRRRGFAGDIVFEHVELRATRRHAPVLHDISFEAKPGEMVALVGLTGAGKTTLVSLIPRFYDPSSGRVLIDGVDVRDYQRPIAARADRDRAAGSGALSRHDRRQPPLRPARRDQRGDPKRGASRRTRTSSSRRLRLATRREVARRRAAACRAASVSA